jgi:phenylacetate-coenzyme A ligase PaaK-like adenylate-forming protein
MTVNGLQEIGTTGKTCGVWSSQSEKWNWDEYIIRQLHPAGINALSQLLKTHNLSPKPFNDEHYQ